MIKTNDRESLSTPQILDQFNTSANIVSRKDNHQERMLYEDIGLEYKFCLNEFEDCQKIIGDERILKQSKFIEKQFKCSLFIYNLKIKDKYDLTKTHNILPRDLEGEEGLKYLELRGHCQEQDLDLF